MRRGLMLCLLALVTVGLARCSKSSKPEADAFVYPLAVGNEWVYHHELYCVGAGCEGDTARDSIVIRVVAIDTPITSPPVYRLEAKRFTEYGVYGAEALYQNRTDGLYCLALQDTGYATLMGRPKESPETGRTIADELERIRNVDAFPGGIHIDSADWYDPPRMALRYPLKGKWRYVIGDQQPPPSNIDKIVLGREKVTTKAGIYDCYKIQWQFSDGLNREVTEYVADSGLVKRVCLLHDVEIGDSLADCIEATELQRVRLVKRLLPDSSKFQLRASERSCGHNLNRIADLTLGATVRKDQAVCAARMWQLPASACHRSPAHRSPSW